ncbi:hypothetical protein [Chromohalobacter japonicus]|uniref:hypothetical protein n=1 Tax=Chromohalobacter japonicus TaxID=223900 RepID=UPI001FF60F92|nr:hypothetical protein [Chromohalobacter japonicus]MCK0752464.1 hypothetical protein [Chromohalobacter japonicus]
MPRRVRILPIVEAAAQADMVGDVQRLQYLEAMGLGAWTSRYRLPNALPTPACEWEAAPVEAPTSHGARLQALLDDAAKVPSTPSSGEASSGATPSRDTDKPVVNASARALLLGDAPPASSSSAPEPAAEAEPATPTADVGETEAHTALRYDLQVAALEGRWLLLVPEASAPDRVAHELLGNLLRAAGIAVDVALEFRSFQWPLVDNAPATAPLDEARDGLRAYLAGQARRGWRPERLLVFGQNTTLDAVLALEEARSETLSLPCWTLPSLSELKSSAAAKRALWPQLASWRDAWAGHDDAS